MSKGQVPISELSLPLPFLSAVSYDIQNAQLPLLISIAYLAKDLLAQIESGDNLAAGITAAQLDFLIRILEK